MPTRTAIQYGVNRNGTELISELISHNFSIQYLICNMLHSWGQHSTASLHYRNCVEIIVLVCEQKPDPGAKAFQQSENIASVVNAVKFMWLKKKYESVTRQNHSKEQLSPMPNYSAERKWSFLASLAVRFINFSQIFFFGFIPTFSSLCPKEIASLQARVFKPSYHFNKKCIENIIVMETI